MKIKRDNTYIALNTMPAHSKHSINVMLFLLLFHSNSSKERVTLICASKNVIAGDNFYNIILLISCNSVLSDLIINKIISGK